MEIGAQLFTVREFCRNTEDFAAEELNACARDSGRVFTIMFNRHTNGIYAKAHQIVREGRLGELKRSVWIITNWYRTQRYYDSGDWRATWVGEGGGVPVTLPVDGAEFNRRLREHMLRCLHPHCELDKLLLHILHRKGDRNRE